MRKFTILVLSVVVSCTFAAAQIEQRPLEVPKTEIYFGYAYQYAGTSGSDIAKFGATNVSSTHLNGFAVEFSHYLHSSFGYTIDVSRGSNNAVDNTGVEYVRTTYMAGPSYRLRNFAFITPSVHVLAGVDRDNFTIPDASTGSPFNQKYTDFAAAAGGTFDGNLSRHLAIRLAQVDYLYTHNYGTSQSSFRYTGGLVVRF